jgi:hypothetical protein
MLQRSSYFPELGKDQYALPLFTDDITDFPQAGEHTAVRFRVSPLSRVMIRMIADLFEFQQRGSYHPLPSDPRFRGTEFFLQCSHKVLVQGCLPLGQQGIRFISTLSGRSRMFVLSVFTLRRIKGPTTCFRRANSPARIPAFSCSPQTPWLFPVAPC